MKLTNLQNKKIALLGLGVENYALLKYLLSHKVKAQFTICDRRSQKELGEKFLELNRFANVFWQLGREFNQKLEHYDILFRSPGWPLHCSGIVEAKKLNVEIIVTSPMQLFFDLCPTKNIIGVTGTKGKGTTSSLIYAIIKEHLKTHTPPFGHPSPSFAKAMVGRQEGNCSRPMVGRRIYSPLERGQGCVTTGMNPKVWLGGNIGIAPFEFLAKLKKSDFVVLELSSFQLEDLNASPHIAVMTNFTPEHLAPSDPHNPNYHKTLADYFKAKLNIAAGQGKNDFLVVNKKMSDVIPAQAGIQSRKNKNLDTGIRRYDSSRIVYFEKSDLASKLVGEHNKENIAAAEAVAKILKINEATVARAVKKFKGLEHRIEPVKEVKGVKYYDDSFATTPESAIIALKSFNDPIILLAGGADKGADFKSLAKEINKRVKFVVLFKGAATPRLKKTLLAAGFKTKNIKIAHSMPEAVKLAQAQAQAGDIVLLSTACASFGLFKNYKQRGDLFKQAVKEL